MEDKKYKQIDIFCIFNLEDKTHMYIGYSSNSKLYYHTLKNRMSDHRCLPHHSKCLTNAKPGLSHFIDYIRSTSEENSWNFEVIESVSNVTVDIIKTKIKKWEDLMTKKFKTRFLNRTDRDNKSKEEYRKYRRNYYHRKKLIEGSSLYRKSKKNEV